ncbi:uncharacterized protein EV420DRAFT_1523435 [Desarmillaria tabescens]|uniref:Uncharacterized protein n=1 Tax=Armillaria tabescens TaxID=1929756 RepID=A0AA39NCQ3_ARMTA|nr:uncharacterized protein EV420DRAFT_1523435 [Desarmillaria tabescens]KAK0463237.1 hypothetical protein EV420DRAFT_1523435 [Desarmillaria tabescens]
MNSRRQPRDPQMSPKHRALPQTLPSSSPQSSTPSCTKTPTSPSQAPKQRGVSAGSEENCIPEIVKYLEEFKNGEASADDVFTFFSSLTEVLSRLENIPSISKALQFDFDITSPLQLVLFHVKTSLKEHLISPPFDQILVEKQTSILQSWIRVLVNSSFSLPRDISGYTYRNHWEKCFRCLDILQWAPLRPIAEDVGPRPDLTHRLRASIPESEDMLWIHFKDYKPFLIFSTQFGCNFPYSSVKVRGSPERLDVTIITVHTLEEAPVSVVDAARHKLPHDVSVRYSTGTLLRLSLPPSSSAVPANHGRSLLKTVCPGESLSPLTFTMPIRPLLWILGIH